MKQWFEFLSTQETAPLDLNNSLCALTATGLLYVGGDDAGEFLQNQLSNDINKIDETNAQISSCSTSKGRVYGIFRVIKIDGGYLLVMPKAILADVQQRLHKFIIMSQVVIADISDSFALMSLVTDNNKPLSKVYFTETVNQVHQSDSLISLQLHSYGGRKRFLLMSNDAAEAIQIWSDLAQELTVNDEDSWKVQEIEAGVPSIAPATSEAFVLQMCNLDALDGVSFKKGCYPGQEVVARMHYLGKLKRRMYLAELDSESCPAPGDELISQGAQKTDGSGKVVDAAYIGNGKCVLLFVAQINKTENGELVLFNQQDNNISLKPLPYSIGE